MEVRRSEEEEEEEGAERARGGEKRKGKEIYRAKKENHVFTDGLERSLQFIRVDSHMTLDWKPGRFQKKKKKKK